MRYFHNDYNETCHPAILRCIQDISGLQMEGYGMDDCCSRAADMIRKCCGNAELAVHFLVGGTQTNLTVIDAALRAHQAVLCAKSGHINVHETGAVEATGHKVLALESDNGKITASQIECAACAHREDVTREHMAQPKLVYLSQPTELGTIYSLRELEDISSVCKRYGLHLFVDGARLGYALAARGNDVTMADLARLADVFYMGGTKIGAMFGEAVVIANPAIGDDFRYLIKQHGGMLAKGWLLGVQFETLLENDLYMDLSAHANAMADRIRDVLEHLGYPMLIPGVTNQIFPILPDRVLDSLEKDFTFSEQMRIDDRHRAVRFCTSWATKPEDVEAFCDALKKLSNLL